MGQQSAENPNVSKTTRYNEKGKRCKKVKFYLFTGVNAELAAGKESFKFESPDKSLSILTRCRQGGRKIPLGEPHVSGCIAASVATFSAAARGAEQYPWANWAKRAVTLPLWQLAKLLCACACAWVARRGL